MLTGYFQKIHWIFIIALMMMMIIIVTVIIKSPFNCLELGFGETFCKYFFVFCPSLLHKDASSLWHALASGLESIRMNYETSLAFKGWGDHFHSTPKSL